MNETSAGRFVLELVSVFDPEGFTKASGALDSFRKSAETTAEAAKQMFESVRTAETESSKQWANQQVQEYSNSTLSDAVNGTLPESRTLQEWQESYILQEELNRTEFFLSRKGQLYETFFGDREVELADWDTSCDEYSQQRQMKNKLLLLQMDKEWDDYSKSITGGFRQAMVEIEVDGTNWTRQWTGVINTATKTASTSVKSFFDSTSDDFMKLDTLARGIFNSILNAFLDMMAQMAAKASILAIFKTAGLFSGNILSTILGGSGGASGGSSSALGGTGGSLSKIENSYLAASGGSGTQNGITINVSPTINLSGSGNSSADARRIAAEITEAAKMGISWAVEQAQVSYKIGKLREREAIL